MQKQLPILLCEKNFYLHWLLCFLVGVVFGVINVILSGSYTLSSFNVFDLILQKWCSICKSGCFYYNGLHLCRYQMNRNSLTVINFGCKYIILQTKWAYQHKGVIISMGPEKRYHSFFGEGISLGLGGGSDMPQIIWIFVSAYSVFQQGQIQQGGGIGWLTTPLFGLV